MSRRLYSVGVDVGTSTTQMILSEITVENRASGFAVPEMEIQDRRIIYRSDVHFTPLKGDSLVDSNAIRGLIGREYEKAGIRPDQVDTGAIIITGETSRKENAAAVLQALSDFAGEFVVATAGPDLESVLAAKGAGAVEYSRKTGKTVVHMDIGGGTSNLALIREGKIVRTGCLNVGGRLVKLADGVVSYVSPVLKGVFPIAVGERQDQTRLQELAKMLCLALEMAAGRQPQGEILEKLSTEEAQQRWIPPGEPVTVSFSGGVADCIETCRAPFDFGDIGPILGQEIAQSSLCQGDYILGEHTIRATVIGAGCHSTQLSGSTVYCRNVRLPKKNLPVVELTRQEQDAKEFVQIVSQRLAQVDSREVVLALPGDENVNYEKISILAENIAAAFKDRPIYICLQGDMAKALGQRLSLNLPVDRSCLCLDKLKFAGQSYLDIGQPVGPCFPVVIKTLILSREN